MDLATTLSSSWGRIWTIARNVFLEVIRDRILYVVGVFGIIMVLAITLLPEVAAGTEDKLILDTALAAINILSLFVVVFIGTGLINKEIEKKTVLVLIAKPVSRTEFILGKHLGLSLVMAVLIAALTAARGNDWHSALKQAGAPARRRPDVGTVDQNVASIRLKVAEQQFYQRRFAGAGAPYQCHGFTWLNQQINVL